MVAFIVLILTVVFLCMGIANHFAENKSSQPVVSSFNKCKFIDEYIQNHPELEVFRYIVPDSKLYEILQDHERYVRVVMGNHSYSFDRWLCPKYYDNFQRARFKRSKEQHIRFLVIDRTHNIGYCLSTVSDERYYRVTFYNCSCPDFAQYSVACKHMYNFAVRVGAMSRDHMLYGVPEDKMKLLKSIYAECYYMPNYLEKLINKATKTVNPHFVSPGKILVHIEGSKRCYKYLADKGFFRIATKDDFDFIDFLCEQYEVEQFKNSVLYIIPLFKFPSRLRKRELYEYVCANNPVVAKKFFELHNHIIMDYEYVTNSKQYISFLQHECPPYLPEDQSHD